MPSNETIYNPISKKQIDLGKTDQYRWSTEFISLLKQKRKVALRLGKLSIRRAYGFRNVENLIPFVMLICSKVQIPLSNRP